MSKKHAGVARAFESSNFHLLNFNVIFKAELCQHTKNQKLHNRFGIDSSSSSYSNEDSISKKIRNTIGIDSQSLISFKKQLYLTLQTMRIHNTRILNETVSYCLFQVSVLTCYFTKLSPGKHFDLAGLSTLFKYSI